MLFVMPAYIHSDQGSAVMSHDLISYLHHQGIGCSNTSIIILEVMIRVADTMGLYGHLWNLLLNLTSSIFCSGR